MKKNYVKLFILLTVTVIITLTLSTIYKQKFWVTSYSYDKLNKITADEFNEYITENPDIILYIGDKNNISINKIEKKFINNLEKLNILENTIYIENNDITPELEKILKKEYKYIYNEKQLPTILVIIDGEIIQKEILEEDSDVYNIINYEVFKW